MKPHRLFLSTCPVFFFAVVCLASDVPSPANVLPDQVGGWQLKGSVTESKDPAVADQPSAAVLKEYGFQRFEKASYTRDDGRTLDVKAAVFNDASGAYGAFTFYKTPAMLNEKIGAQASSLNNRVLFYQGNVLIDAVFDKLTVMSAAELRELAGLIPRPSGNSANLPSLPVYLPKQAYEKNTAKYVLGPVTLDRVGTPIPTPLVDFKSGAEVEVAKYEIAGGDATLMLIEYPTPQLAIEKLKQIDALHGTRPQARQPEVASIVDVVPFFVKRTGPIIVIAAGPLSQNEANALLGSINYEADVTWNENTYVSKKDNLANLLFNVIILCGIVVGLALIAGLAFGGFRLMMKRLFPDKVFDRREDIEIISLHLEEVVRITPEER
jgi:hypothetical protein